jgi:hypothetical protein
MPSGVGHCHVRVRAQDSRGSSFGEAGKVLGQLVTGDDTPLREPRPGGPCKQCTSAQPIISSVTLAMLQPMELATCEKTVFALEPIIRSVPTTISRITATITAYSAMSCPSSEEKRTRSRHMANSPLFFNSFVISPLLANLVTKVTLTRHKTHPTLNA